MTDISTCAKGDGRRRSYVEIQAVFENIESKEWALNNICSQYTLSIVQTKVKKFFKKGSKCESP